MIKILVVDDKVDKINDTVKFIKEKYNDEEVDIKIASFVIDAKKILANTSIDILVLDICLPERPGDNLKEDAGINLLKQINGSKRYTYPRFVIALSEYEELIDRFQLNSGIIHKSILYNVSSNEWIIRLEEIMDIAIPIISNNIRKRSYNYDVAVICALEEELEFVKKSLDDISEVSATDDDYIYYKGTFVKDKEKRKVIMAQSTHMGMVPASTLTTRLIYNFSPRYVVMTGIAAGIKEKVSFGDVIVAEYVWDYGAGKEVLEGNESVHRNTIQQISIDADILNIIKRVSNNKSLLDDIKKDFMGVKPASELKIIVGPVASGASVIANPQVVDNIKNSQIRDIVGVEMEIFGVYYAARWAVSPKPKFLALKSVCDFADSTKDDKYHAYASYTSAKIFTTLVKEYFDYEF